MSRLVTEDELFMFQVCPALLSIAKSNSEVISCEHYWSLKDKVQAELLRNSFAMWLRRNRKPELKRIRQMWDTMAVKACVQAELSASITKEILVNGSSGNTKIWEDVEKRGYQVSQAKMPVPMQFKGVVLQTMPDAIVINPGKEVLLINIGPEFTTREIVNNLIYRARLLAVSTLLKQEVRFIHYNFSGRRREFSSFTLCYPQLYKDVYHTVTAIGDDYSVPIGDLGECAGNCKYYKECYL